MPAAQWWKGVRGEWYVLAQFVLIGLVLLGPRTCCGRPHGSSSWPSVVPIVGAVLTCLGGLLMGAAALNLGASLTPWPRPRESTTLVTTGPYRLVRHPIYGGGLLAALGWALVVQSFLTLGYVGLLLVLMDLKSRREERWLLEKFPEYREYQRRVSKLIPFVY
jgi:protein-S-isoprenylcysteine O-methyltransferase Ste14